MFNFAPQWRDPACAGDFGLALRRSVSVNLAELWRAPSKGGEGNFEGVKPRRGPRPIRGRSGRGGVKEEGWKV